MRTQGFSEGVNMKVGRKWFIIGIAVTLCLCVAPASVAQKGSVKGNPHAKPPRDYPVKPVPFTSVHFNDVFWAPRIEINRAVTIPFAFGKNEETGRVDNFVRAATALRGEALANKKAPGY